MLAAAQLHLPFNTTLTGIALAALLGWLLLLQVAVWASRPDGIQPGPESLDHGPESPAVANLLVGGWRLTPDAATGTLVDLAARRVLAFEQQGPEAARTVVRVRDPHPTGLTPYEQRLFNRIAALARGGVVPAAALVRGDEKWAQRWWRQFRKEAIGEARSRGLSRDRWSAGTLSLLRGTALIPVLAACAMILSSPTPLTDDQHESRWSGVFPTVIFGWAALIALVNRLRQERDTPAGREAAARWLGYRDHLARDESFEGLPPAAVAIWDRHLAYAASFGIARTTVRALPLGARSDKVAWSAYGGSWHQIRIRYPRGTWGYSPWQACWRGLGQLGIGIVGLYWLLRLRSDVTDQLGTLHDRADRFAWVYWAPIAIALYLIARGSVKLIRGLAEYPSRREQVGEVVRLVTRQSGDSDHPSYLYFAAIDTGRSPRTRAYRVTGAQHSALDEGDEVRVVVGPYLGRIFSLDTLKEADTPADEEYFDAASPSVAAAVSTPVVVPDPGELISAADVSAALGGVPVTAREAGPSGGLPFLHARLCQYEPAQPGYPRLMVQVSSGALARRLAGSMRKRGRPVPGIPDAYAGGSDSRPSIVLLRGEVALGIHGIDKDVNPALLHRLAATAATRLAQPATPAPTPPGTYAPPAAPGPYAPPVAGSYAPPVAGSYTPPVAPGAYAPPAGPAPYAPPAAPGSSPPPPAPGSYAPPGAPGWGG